MKLPPSVRLGGVIGAAGNFPAVADRSEAAWSQARRRFEAILSITEHGEDEPDGAERDPGLRLGEAGVLTTEGLPQFGAAFADRRGQARGVVGAGAFEADLVKLRRHFHAHPELAFHEVETAAECARQVAALGFTVRTGVGITGVVAELRNGDGPTIALRADMDALPILEENDVSYRSKHDGVMHACGHDVHASWAVGAAALLARSPADGDVVVLLQPAEETGRGALAMIDAAVESADRFYPAFDFLLRGAKSPSDAMAACMFETVGRA